MSATEQQHADSRSARIAVRLEPDLRVKVELAAQRDRRTMSDFVRILIEDRLGFSDTERAA